LRNHADAFIHILQAVIRSLEDKSTSISNRLHRLGEFHVPLKVDIVHYWRIWPAVDYMLKETLSHLYTDDAHEAWSIVFDYMAERMATGAQNYTRLICKDTKNAGVVCQRNAETVCQNDAEEVCQRNIEEWLSVSDETLH